MGMLAVFFSSVTIIFLFIVVTGLIVMLSTADVMRRAYASSILDPSMLTAQPVFAVFQGEAWDLVGSRKFVDDIQRFVCRKVKYGSLKYTLEHKSTHITFHFDFLLCSTKTQISVSGHSHRISIFSGFDWTKSLRFWR